MRARLIAAGFLATWLTACGPTPSPTATPPGVFTIQVQGFSGGTVVAAATCDGPDHALTVTWSGLPAGTKSIGITVVDPDASGFVHWDTVTDTGTAPPAGFDPANAAGWVEGRNSFGGTGYRGPCPPRGQTHHYTLTVNAYDVAVATRLGKAFTLDQLRSVTASHLLASAHQTATYGH